jgi:hypothetical protein
MTDDDPDMVDAGHWERLIAYPNPGDVLTGAWSSPVADVHLAAMDIEVIFT